ncbi:hypothetical protein CIB84_004019, partial [Bambusicola thoracicus]
AQSNGSLKTRGTTAALPCSRSGRGLAHRFPSHSAVLRPSQRCRRANRGIPASGPHRCRRAAARQLPLRRHLLSPTPSGAAAEDSSETPSVRPRAAVAERLPGSPLRSGPRHSRSCGGPIPTAAPELRRPPGIYSDVLETLQYAASPATNAQSYFKQAPLQREAGEGVRCPRGAEPGSSGRGQGHTARSSPPLRCRGRPAQDAFPAPRALPGRRSRVRTCRRRV